MCYFLTIGSIFLELDKQLLLLLNFDGGYVLDTLFYFISMKLTWVPLYLLILYAFWRKYGTRPMLITTLILVLAIVTDDQICNFFKTVMPKFRPSHNPQIQQMVHTVLGYRGGLYGTVSAHSAISFSVAIFSALCFKTSWYSVAIFLWAIIVAYSRIYLGVHFPLDILFGALLGTTLGYAAYRIQKRFIK